MRSILANLLSNAIKYSPKGGQVELHLIFAAEQIQLQICDQGVGIAKEDQKQLFEAFHRGKNVRHITGTGLGLAVVKKCVDLHGGKINIVSAIGQGTKVTITLPRSA